MVKREQLPKLLSLGYVHCVSVTKVGDVFLVGLSQLLCGAPGLFLFIFCSPNFRESKCCIFLQGLHQRLPPLKSLPWLSEPAGTHSHPTPLYPLCAGSGSGAGHRHLQLVSVSWWGYLCAIWSLWYTQWTPVTVCGINKQGKNQTMEQLKLK